MVTSRTAMRNEPLIFGFRAAILGVGLTGLATALFPDHAPKLLGAMFFWTLMAVFLLPLLYETYCFRQIYVPRWFRRGPQQ